MSSDAVRVESLDYEAYVPMATQQIKDIILNTRQRFPSLINIAIHHKLGKCGVKEESVVIVVSSPHRKDALEAVEHCIDELKAKVVIWKKEVYTDGSSCWKKNSECM